MEDARKTLGWIFAITSFMMIAGNAVVVWDQVEHGALAWPAAAQPAQGALLGLGILFGVAGWAVLTAKRSARFWGLAASAAAILLDVAVVVLARRQGVKIGTPWLTLLFGATGLFVFSSSDEAGEARWEEERRQRVAGDGTHLAFEWLIWIGQVAGFLAGMNWWWHWGKTHGLAWGDGFFWIDVVLAALITTAIHEAGHASVGRALGLQLNAFVAGPLQWRVRGGAWRFEFRLAGFLSAEGATGIDLGDPRLSRWRAACMMAAGPAANLVTGLVMLWAALTAAQQPWRAAWLLLGLTATYSLLASVLNLIPARTGAAYTDGANLSQILSGRPWAAIHVGNEKLLRKQGLEAQLAGRPAEAEEYFRKALALGSEIGEKSRVRLLVCLGDALADQGWNDEAKESLEKALRLGDPIGSAQGSMADLLLAEKSDPERALALSEEARERSTAKSEAGEDSSIRAMLQAKYWARKAQALVQLGRRREAQSAVKTAAQIMKEARQPRPNGWGAADTVFGRPSETFRELVTAAVSWSIGQALVALDEDEQAAEFFMIARDTDPKGKYRTLATQALERVEQLVAQ